jgi:lipopolysaccharide/colanic/teichoic acid biosynthesis glycosyltransferase
MRLGKKSRVSAAGSSECTVAELSRRLTDVIVTLIGLTLLAPLLLMAALAILIDSPGPVLYWQERVGRYGCPFRLLKLRTMVANAEADGQAIWARNQDPRVTRVGAVMRRSHIDEIPQLWNVLRGEMSLIGPRPERPEFMALLSASLPEYSKRHIIRPGITGWAQVQYGYGASVEDAAAKLEYDLFYIRHRSLPLDATIVLRTLLLMLRFQGT